MTDIVRDPYGNPLNRDKLTTALRAENERLRKMLWEINEQCPEHVPIYLMKQIRAVLEEKSDDR